MIVNSRGTALWESLPVISVLLVIAGGCLLLAYASIGRSWLLYRAEQGLYCVVEDQDPDHCAKTFVLMGKAYLPWGELYLHKLSRTKTGAEIDAEWRLGGLQLRVQRQMDLRSSALSDSSL